MLLYSNHFEFNSSRFLPSRLGMDLSAFQISLPTFHFWMANNSLSANNILGKGTTNNLIDNALRRMGPQSDMKFGMDFQWVAFAITVMTKGDGIIKKPVFSLSGGVTEQLGVGFRISKNFFELAWNGNKQFEDQTISLAPLSLNALYNREYFIGFAFPLLNKTKFQWRMGGRIKYLQGIGSIYMPFSNKGDFYTAPEGRSIELDLDMKINTAGISQSFSPFDMNGRGVGADLGMTFVTNKRSFMHFSLLDIGKITFDKKTREISNSQKVVYNGLIFTGLFGGELESQLDSLSTILDSDIHDGVKFDMPLSTRFIFQYEFRTPMISRKGKPYYSNSFYITYVQGFDNMPRNSTKPLFMFAYGRDLNSSLNMGANLGFGGVNSVTLGAFASFRLGPLRYGVGVGNIAGLLIKKIASGVDFTFQITFASRAN